MSAEYKKLIADLNEYNRWRRGDDDSLPMPDPKAVGVMIEGAAKAIESLQAELAKYRDAPVVAWRHTSNRAVIDNGVIEDVRKKSGAWIPLIVKPGE